MPENRFHYSAAATALLVAVLFLSAALLTYHAGDSPRGLVYPTAASPTNVLGTPGARIADMLYHGVGWGSLYLLISLLILDRALFQRRIWQEPLVRLGGWLLSLAGFCTLAAFLLPGWSPGPVIGAGGYLGAACGGFLARHFAEPGTYILPIGFLLSGLILAFDDAGLARAGRSLSGLKEGMASRKALFKGSKVSHEEHADDEEDAPIGGMKIKIGKRRGDADELTDEDLHREARLNTAASDVEEEEEYEEEPAPARRSVGRRLAKALRINSRKCSKNDNLVELLEGAGQGDEEVDYELPSWDLLLPGDSRFTEEHERQVRRNAKLLEETFSSFGFQVSVVEIETGPVISQYEVELEAGLRLSKITSLADDVAIALRVPSVRIVAPIPGKNTVGIEVPNPERQLVRLREVLEQTQTKVRESQIPIFLGKDVSGNPLLVDLATMPHLLIAGRTGTGKSVCLNSLIVSILMTRRPDEVRLLMIDPKMVELSPYKKLPHLMHPVVTDMKKAEAILAWAVEKMEERYALLARAGVRHMSVYNQLGEEELMDRLQPETDEEREQIPLHLPYIVIVADEMADLMMTAAKEVEQHIIRLAQKSRAVGIHLVLATQKPTVDVITGLIKSNLPARIAFQVSSRTDSRVVLDEMGADRLLGNGDLLFLWPGTSTLIRGQGAFVDDDEINRIVSFVGTSEPQYVHELVQLQTQDESKAASPASDRRDELYGSAVEIVLRENRGSVSLLQRSLGIGYGRAARLIDYMEEDGVVGPYNGSQAREILISRDEWRDLQSTDDSGTEWPVDEDVLEGDEEFDDEEDFEEAPFEEDELEEEYEEGVDDESWEEEETDEEEEEFEPHDLPAPHVTRATRRPQRGTGRPASSKAKRPLKSDRVRRV